MRNVLKMALCPALNIAFSEFDCQPVVAVLNDMHQLIERILLAFEEHFSARASACPADYGH
jgi:hypothetical protein